MFRTLVGSRMLVLDVCGRISNQKPKESSKRATTHQQHDFKINPKKAIEVSVD